LKQHFKQQAPVLYKIVHLPQVQPATVMLMLQLAEQAFRQQMYSTVVSLTAWHTG